MKNQILKIFKFFLTYKQVLMVQLECCSAMKNWWIKNIHEKKFQGSRYNKCVNSAAALNGSSITTSTLKSTSAKKITTKQKQFLYLVISAAIWRVTMENYFLIIISFNEPLYLLT